MPQPQPHHDFSSSVSPKPRERSTALVYSVMERMRASRGRARQFWHVFGTSRMPMLMVDSQGHYRAANDPARLIFRLSLEQLLDRHLGDLTAPYGRTFARDRWEQLMSGENLAGRHTVEFPDGGQLSIVYAALANALPGLHLIVFAPSDWPEDEFVESPEAPDRRPRPLLSQREQEVLSLIAAGADQQQMADELTIAVPTVRTHVRNLLRKLGARNRPHAIALAMQDGLFDDPVDFSDEA